jgi:signal transduction histidine kinase
MSIDDLLITFVEGLLLFLAAISILGYLRRPRPTQLDIALVFGSLGANVALNILAQAIQARWLGIAGAIAGGIQPYLLVRLVRHFRPVPRWVSYLSLSGLIATVVIIIAARPHRPLAFELLIIAYFVSSGGYAAVAFLREARRTSGITHRRLFLISTGTALFACAFLVAVAVIIWPDRREIIAASVRFVLVAALISYYLGFATPRWLRRIWGLLELRRFLGDARSPDEQTAITHLRQAAIRVVDGMSSVVIRREETALSHMVAADTVGRVCAERRPVLTHTNADSPKPCYVSPIFTDDRTWGLLLVPLRNEPLFPDDDLDLLSLLSQQTAITLDYGALLSEQRSLNVTLEEHVRERTAELSNEIAERKHLEEQLVQSQKMEAVGRLAGGIAHDFNNLLTAIIGYSQLVMSRLDQSDPMRRQIEEIEKAGKRASTLTSQLLAFSRKQVLQPRVLNLNELIADIGKMLQRLIGEDVELRTNLDRGIGSVKADPGQVEQIIMNLAVNARDAMPKGGKLTIETQNVYLDEAYATEHAEVQSGPHVMMAISDTGTGMDRETQARIFEPFFTTKEKGRGTGLGLSTVYGIVKQSGGHIWIYSEVGKGTAFKIYLPRVEEMAEEMETPSPLGESLRGMETILLVEDEEAVRKLAVQVLRLNGYTVLEAADATEALQIYEQYEGTIHLIITDVVMPGLSGRELADRLAPFRPEMSVLYMSGYTDNAIVHHGVLDAGTAFLQKPFTPDDLARKVREVLEAP